MSFIIPAAALGNSHHADVPEKKEKLPVEEIKNHELSDEEAELGRTKQRMFEAGVSNGLALSQIIQPIPRTYASATIHEPSVPAEMVIMALDLGEIFCEQLSQIETSQLPEFLKNWAELDPEHESITRTLSTYIHEHPYDAAGFIQDVLDCHQNVDEKLPQTSPQSSINTNWGAVLSAHLLKKLPSLDIPHAYKEFIKLDKIHVVEKKDFVQVELQLLYRTISFMFLLQHYDQIQTLLNTEEKSNHFVPFIDYVNKQRVEKNILTLHQDIQKKISNCMSVYLHTAAALEEVLELLERIVGASVERRVELSNYLALMDEIGEQETDCLLWNELLAAKIKLPENLAKLLMEQVQLLTNQPE